MSSPRRRSSPQPHPFETLRQSTQEGARLPRPLMDASSPEDERYIAMGAYLAIESVLKGNIPQEELRQRISQLAFTTRAPRWSVATLLFVWLKLLKREWEFHQRDAYSAAHSPTETHKSFFYSNVEHAREVITDLIARALRDALQCARSNREGPTFKQLCQLATRVVVSPKLPSAESSAPIPLLTLWASIEAKTEILQKIQAQLTQPHSLPQENGVSTAPHPPTETRDLRHALELILMGLYPAIQQSLAHAGQTPSANGEDEAGQRKTARQIWTEHTLKAISLVCDERKEDFLASLWDVAISWASPQGDLQSPPPAQQELQRQGITEAIKLYVGAHLASAATGVAQAVEQGSASVEEVVAYLQQRLRHGGISTPLGFHRYGVKSLSVALLAESLDLLASLLASHPNKEGTNFLPDELFPPDIHLSLRSSLGKIKRKIPSQPLHLVLQEISRRLKGTGL